MTPSPSKARKSSPIRGCSLAALAVLIAGLGSCVTGVDVGEPVNPVPLLRLVQPTLLTVGQASRLVQLVGADFTEQSEGLWNGQPRPTQFVSASELRVTLEPGDIASRTTGSISVSTPAPGGGVSSVLRVDVGSALPVIDSLSPATATAQTSSITLRVFGEGFTDYASGSFVTFDEASLATTVVSESELRAVVDVSLMPRGATVQVTVVNPAPGGGGSAPASFTIMNPVASLTDIVPDTLPIYHTYPAQMGLTGTGFVPGTVVWVDSVPYEPSSVTPTSLSFFKADNGIRGGRVWVETPGPGGGVSNELTFYQSEREPQIAHLEPQAVEVGSGSQIMRIIGRQFAYDAVATWNGDTLPTVEYRGGGSPDAPLADTLVVTIPASLSGAVGPADLIVHNPRAGGPSAPFSSAVVPPGRIALSGEAGLVSVDLSGANLVDIPLATELGETAHAVAIDVWPTGQDVIFQKSIGYIALPGIYRGGPGVSETLILAEDVRTPRLSGDGQWIFFNDNRWQAGDTIWRVAVDGTQRTAVVAGGVHPEPSPVRDELVYRSTATGDLTLLDLGTGATIGLGVSALDSRWSPDGEWIAYRAQDRLHVMRRDGSERRPLARIRSRYTLTGMFDWSPDGRYVLGIDQYGAFELADVITDLVLRYAAPTPDPDVAYLGEGRLAWYPSP